MTAGFQFEVLGFDPVQPESFVKQAAVFRGHWGVIQRMGEESWWRFAGDLALVGEVKQEFRAGIGAEQVLF